MTEGGAVRGFITIARRGDKTLAMHRRQITAPTDDRPAEHRSRVFLSDDRPAAGPIKFPRRARDGKW